MAITSLTLDQETYERLGIGIAQLPLTPPLRLRGLGNLVVLAGANGSGKSRFLNLLQDLMRKHLPRDSQRELARQLRAAQAQIAHLEGYVEGIKVKLDPNITELTLADSITAHEQTITQVRQEVVRLMSAIQATKVLQTSSENVPQIVSFVPKLARLQDPVHVVESEADSRATRLRNLGTDSAEQNAPAYARSILRAALRGRDERRSKGLVEISSQESAELELSQLVQSLIGDDVVLRLDDSLNLTIGRWRTYETALSAGQQVLFQFACLLHAQGAALDDCIVLLDEPENHLHPAVLNQVIDKLREKLTKGQLWIATHSVPLVAHAVAKEPECLWYVEGGRVQHAGRSPEAVLEGLMGGPASAKHLHDFTLLPAQFAALRFLSECLTPPGVVGPDVKDPQTNQIASLLHRRRAANGKLRVLDFGAGKARLLATLAALGSPASEWLDYIAFDPSAENDAERQMELNAVYGSKGEGRNFADLSSLRTKVDAASVDVVVMCNVLHEIEPTHWDVLFGSGGVLTTLLGADGNLLVVEDYGMPVGELAHRYGFLLLDEPELLTLFAVLESDRDGKRYLRETPSAERYRDRLVAHAVGSEFLGRYSAQTQRSAIKVLHDRMSAALDTMLSAGAISKGNEGRYYARTAQLMANAAIWLQHHKA